MDAHINTFVLFIYKNMLFIFTKALELYAGSCILSVLGKQKFLLTAFFIGALNENHLSRQQKS